jgi:3-phenylpropionate/trans-cinnamate dioxygenase ferredoxin reductase subunit
VFRGDVDSLEFVAFWLDADNHVLAGMNVNIWDVLDDIKNMISNKAVVDLNKLIDPEASLKDQISGS